MTGDEMSPTGRGLEILGDPDVYACEGESCLLVEDPAREIDREDEDGASGPASGRPSEREPRS